MDETRGRGAQAATGSPVRVLFVCTGNSARSQMAEAVLRAHGGTAFAAASAGTHPRGVHPMTIRALSEGGIDASGLTSTGVQELVDQPFDHVITVCDQARESCPVFPGARHVSHWALEDPAAAEGSDDARLQAFRRTLELITVRVDAFIRQARPGAAPR